jgi:hypothetical protein
MVMANAGAARKTKTRSAPRTKTRRGDHIEKTYSMVESILGHATMVVSLAATGAALFL